MTPASRKSPERAQKLDEVIAAFLEAEQNDATSDRHAWLQRYPDLADDLHRFFEQHERLARLAAPLREADPVPTTDATTITDVPRTLGDADAEVPRFFGDYEILEEIAHGGMGVVYKARQISLNRMVALKMIRAGQLASAQDVARFHSEAEAVATLDHPNILPIYEVGEHDGHHFFAMKLIAGGSLSDRVKALRQTPREAARLVAVAARAMYFAHQRGILHRDLKPSNILLDERGEPFVVDFGLAKKMGTDSGLTQSGAIVGTPSYMAPEQAVAQKGLTVAVDIYALGAILYTLLTGRPPFRGANIVETLRQVVEHEPTSPRSVNAQVPRDLEAICLKCLAKEPDRRYRSAQDLADDLERFGRGEPVAVRRVGRMERLVKWARRRPAVAGLLAAVLLLAFLGGLTTYFAVQWHKADLARMQAAERVLDRMAQTTSPSDLAALGQKLADLAEQLGPDEAAKVAERILDQMDKTTDPGALAKTVMQLAERLKPEESSRVCAKAAQKVLDRMDDQTTNPAALANTVLIQLAERLKPDEFAKVAECIPERMDKTTNPYARSALAGALVKLEERRGPDEIAKVAERILDRMDKTTDPGALAWALVKLAERLKPEESSRVCAKAAQKVLDRMDKTTNQDALAQTEIRKSPPKPTDPGALAQTVMQLAERVKPDEVAKVAEHALDRMDKTTNPAALAQALAKLAERLKPEESARVCARAAQKVIDRMDKITNQDSFAGALVKLAERLKPDEVAKVAERVLDRMDKTTDPSTVAVLARALVKLAERLGPEEAAKAAQRVLDRIYKTPPILHDFLAQTLVKLAERLKPDEAAKAAQRVLDWMDKATRPYALGRALVKLAERLGPDEAAKAAQLVFDRMDKTTDQYAQNSLAEALVKLAEQLKPDEAAKAAQRVLDWMDKTTNLNAEHHLAQALAMLAERCSDQQLVELLKHPRCVGAAREKVQAALDKRK